MRILIVAMAESIHTARWISQIADQGWDVHLFPSRDIGLTNAALRNVTVHHTIYARPPEADPSVKMRGLHFQIPFLNKKSYILRRRIATGLRLAVAQYRPHYHTRFLMHVIRKLKPDIVHSIEFQYGGYLTLSARQQLGDYPFPTWIATNWGSDIYLYGRLAQHREQIEKILVLCDYYSCECERDVQLALEKGLKGKVLPVFPNSGGFDLERTAQLHQPGPPSARRQIIMKGYQHFAGRALVGLRAIELCADVLKDYRIVIYSAFAEVIIAAELVAQSTGLQIDILPPCSHEALLAEYGKSRMYIGLSISDAISTSLLEAMVMGALPIQSGTACANEWITDGESGLIVPPEDPQIIAEAIRRAVLDDALVDQAAEINAQTCAERLDYRQLKEKTVAFYQQAFSGE